MNAFFDTHAHLDYPDYSPDLADVIARAQAAGISKIISIGTTLASSERAIWLAEKCPDSLATRLPPPAMATKERKERRDPG